MSNEITVKHFSQLPKTEIGCGAGRNYLIRHYPGGHLYLERDEPTGLRNNFLGFEEARAVKAVTGCRRCLSQPNRECDIRSPDAYKRNFSFEPQSIKGEVLSPYIPFIDYSELEEVRMAASLAGLKFKLLVEPGQTYFNDLSGNREVCPSDKCRVALGEGKNDETENKQMLSFWAEWRKIKQSKDEY